MGRDARGARVRPASASSSSRTARRTATRRRSSRRCSTRSPSARLYFVVASGFTLVFGLMRVVNMAHGSLYLVAAYVAINVQRRIITGNPTSPSPRSQVSVRQLVRRAARRGGRSPALLGLAMQQVLPALEPGPGSAAGADHDRALGDRGRPGRRAHGRRHGRGHVVPGAGSTSSSTCTSRLLATRARACSSSASRSSIGIALWLWLKRTRTGMVIRAGVDDRAMVAALGVNIQRDFMIAFFVGSALAGIGAVIGTSQTAVANGTDGTWLLNSLVVVIIGGMGSLGGAGRRLDALRHHRHVLGRLPAGRATRSTRSSSRSSCSRSCSPSARTASSGGPRELRRSTIERSHRAASRSRSPCSRRCCSRTYTVDQLLTQVLIFGIVAMSLDLPRVVRRHGLARADGALRHRRLRLRQHDDGRHEGPDARLQPVGRHPARDPDRDRDRPRLRRRSRRARPASTSS